jgi:hypothetical protein
VGESKSCAKVRYNSSHKRAIRRTLGPGHFARFVSIDAPSIVTITLADVSPVAIVVAVQSSRYKGVCPYPAHLFIDVLAKVGYVKNATSIVQVRIYQVSPEAVEYG